MLVFFPLMDTAVMHRYLNTHLCRCNLSAGVRKQIAFTRMNWKKMRWQGECGRASAHEHVCVRACVVCARARVCECLKISI